jgi:hypothetical protein
VDKDKVCRRLDEENVQKMMVVDRALVLSKRKGLVAAEGQLLIVAGLRFIDFDPNKTYVKELLERGHFGQNITD